MAKSLKQQQAQIAKEFDELARLQAEWDKILEKKRKGQKYDEERLKELEKEFKYYTTLANKVNELADNFNTYNKKIEESNKKIAESVENFDEVEESIKSIGFGISKNEKLHGAFADKIKESKVTLKSVSAILQNQSGLSQNQIDNAENVSKAYKNVFTSVGDASKELKRNNITQTEFNDIVKRSYKEFDTLIDGIDDSTESGKALKQTFQDAYGTMESFNKAAEKSAKQMELLDTAVDQLGSSGIPLVGDLGRAFNNLANRDIKGAKLAITALGAAAAGLAFNYFGAEMQAGVVAANDVKATQIDGAREIAKINSDAAFIPQKIQQEQIASSIEAGNNINKLTLEATFAAEKAAESFSASMKSAAVQFAAASKTALFGNKLGGVGYGAAQLQMAGISAEKIAGAMSAASSATGKMPTGKMGADMSIMAERTGQSVENIASINETFQRLDGVSAQTAINMQEGMRAMADNAGISLSNLMTEVAEASKDALSYQIKSGPALAKQVAYAQSMGVSFGDVAKAGKNMVMNYKDSIKAEMQLSSLLGEQVDLSEVRAKFAAGDTEGALEAIKAQGLDPAQMDMFQQQALQDALGGLDLNSISKVAQNTGAQVGELKAGQAGKQNQSFLSRTVSAQATMEAQQAQIQADQAIIDASLSEKINQAYLGSPEYKAYQEALVNQSINQAKLNTEMEIAFQKSPGYIQALADTAKLQIERSFTENIGPALAATVGGILSNKLADLILPSEKSGGSIGSDVTPDDSKTKGGKTKGGKVKGGKKGFFGKVGGFFSNASKSGGGLFKGGKGLLGSVGKLGKVVPGLSNILSGVGAISNLMEGDFASAGLDLLGAVPVIGNVLNVARATGLTDGIEESLNKSVSALMPKGTTDALGSISKVSDIAKNVKGGNLAGAATGAIGMVASKKDTPPPVAPASAVPPPISANVPMSVANTPAPSIPKPAGMLLPAIGVAATGIAAAAAKPTAPVSVAATPATATTAPPATPVSVTPPTMQSADKILEKIQKESNTRGIIMVQRIDNVFKKMSEVNGNMQKTVDRTHKSATSLNQLDNTAKQLLQVNKNLQALMAVMAFEGKAATQLIIDGKTVASMLQRRADNRMGQAPVTGTPAT